MPRSAIGVSRPRLDSEAKVAGTLRYAADEAVPGLLHGRLVLSTEAHATIERVDIASALEVPGVVRVLTYEDLPLAGTEDARTYQPLADREALYVGQPVAIVLAETEAAAEDGVDRVAVDYTPLEPVLDLEAAMAVASPLARHGRQGGQAAGLGAHAPAAQASEALPEEELSANVAARHHYRHGDAASALASADVVVGGRFRTSWVYQAYLEPQIATAWVEPDGELVVRSSTQAIFYTQHELSKLYGLAVMQVRVAATPLGGGFGAKWLVIEPLVAGAALAAGRPVRLAMTRSEDLAAASPAPATIIDLRIGAHGDGRLAALTSRIVADTGAFSELSSDGITAVLVAGGYHWPAYEIASHGVLTNRVAAGSLPGAGRAARRVRARDPSRRARRAPSDRSHRAPGCGTSLPKASRWWTGAIGLRTASATASRPSGSIPSGAGEVTFRRAKGLASGSESGWARRRRRAPSAGSIATAV